MTNVLGRNLVVLAIGIFPFAAAHADPTWFVDVTGDPNTACELKKPFRVSTAGSSLGDVWVGFYWLRQESSVPGHTLPANEVIFVVKTEQDLDDTGEEYDDPTEAYIGETQLKKYQLEYHVGGHAFFFVGGNTSQHLLDELKTAAEVDVRFEFKDKNAEVLEVRVSKEERFKVLAAMFSTCGEAIRRPSSAVRRKAT